MTNLNELISLWFARDCLWQGPDVLEDADLIDMSIDNELHRQRILQAVDEQPSMEPFGQ